MQSDAAYLVVLKLKQWDFGRLAEMVPLLEAQLSKISADKAYLALRSNDAGMFGYFIRSNKRAQQIRAELESPGNWLKGGVPFLSGDDQILVLSLGDDFAATRGLTQAQTWLQRHSGRSLD